MFKELIGNDGAFLGYSLTRSNIFYFFGSRHMHLDLLKQTFHAYNFCLLKQVHGRRVIGADPQNVQEADAHFTNVRNRALIVQTADCLPILLASPHQVCAIHAGWRGLEQNIIREVKETLPDYAPDFAAFGPHIGAQSFEVGLDVAASLRKMCADPLLQFEHPHPDPNKIFFDLKTLGLNQLRSTFGSGLTTAECCEDTKRAPERFYSYRRDGGGKGRQYSFVVIQ